MRKIALALILLLTAATLISCSQGGNQAPGQSASPEPPAIETTGNTAEVAIEETEEGPEPGIKVSLGEIGENMSLPDSFPKEVFPLPDDANIINVNENSHTSGVGIIFMTGKSFDEAVAYCRELMNSGSITLEDKQADSYLLMGSKDNYNIMITVSKYNGENISILFDVTPQ